MGEKNLIGCNFWSSEPYLIQIGSHCQITTGVKFLTHGGSAVVRDIYPNFDCFGKIKIGDYVYIGANSLIMPGVTLGDHVLVAAGSVVTKSVKDWTVVGGNPAKVLCTVNEYMEKNMKYNINTKGLSAIDKKKVLALLSDEKYIVKDYL